MAIGIYRLSFPNTDKVYIGQSINMSNRRASHMNSFIRGYATKKLQEAYRVYGTPEFTIQEECTKEELNTKELYYINKYNSVVDGFNSIYSALDGSGLYGEDCYSANYTNDKYIEALFFIINNKELSLPEISKLSDISVGVLIQIQAGNSHKWLEKLYPEEYKQMLAMKGNRHTYKQHPQTTSKLDKETVYSVLKLLIVLPRIKHDKISELTGVSVNTIRDINSCRRYKWLHEAYPDEYKQLSNFKKLLEK